MIKKSLLVKVSLCCLGFLTFVYGMQVLGKPYLDSWINSNSKAVSQTKNQKVIYLTFDDGPSKNTPAVLDILKKYQVRATFFVTGEQPDYVKYIKQASKEGHVIGIHTYTHAYQTIYAGEVNYLDDFQKVSDLILEQTNHLSKIFRFPGGSSNTVSRKYSPGVVSVLAKKLLANGYQYYDWNASCGDGDTGRSPQSLIDQSIREAKGKDQVMLLLHDGAGNQATVKALPSIIEAFQKQGYRFEVIREGTDGFHHHIAN